MDGIGQEAIRRAGTGGAAGVPAAIARAERLAPGAEAREPVQGAVAVELPQRDEPGRLAHEARIRGEKEWGERHRLDADGAAVTEPQPDGAAVVRERRGHEAGRAVRAEQQRGRVAQAVASSTAARYIAASTRPTSARPVSGTMTVGMERTPSATAAS